MKECVFVLLLERMCFYFLGRFLASLAGRSRKLPGIHAGVKSSSLTMADYRFSALKVPSSSSIFFTTFRTISNVSVEPRTVQRGRSTGLLSHLMGFQILTSFSSVLNFYDLYEYNL